jgi:hypothetical protein
MHRHMTSLSEQLIYRSIHSLQVLTIIIQITQVLQHLVNAAAGRSEQQVGSSRPPPTYHYPQGVVCVPALV